MPPDILWKIINLLLWVLAAIGSIGVSVFVYFHKSLMRRLDKIDEDLKPVIMEQSLQKQTLQQHSDKLQDHDIRIKELENRIR